MQKGLYKSSTNILADGVCGGIAERFEFKSVWVRLAFISVTLLLALLGAGSGLICYIVCDIIMPKKQP